MKRTAPIRLVSFFLVAACGAMGQGELTAADSLHAEASNLPGVQYQETPASRSLPDAPSAQYSTQAKLRGFVNESRSPLVFGPAGLNLGEEKANLSSTYAVTFTEDASSRFFEKYLYPSLLKQNPRYHPSTSESFLGRATYAASRILVTHDDSGKGKLNGAYFLGVLASVAIHTAHRPSGLRTASEPFNNFGSMLGSDAGMNLFHEFGPGLRQLAKGHEPRFMSRIQDRVMRDQNRGFVPTPPK